MNSSLSRPANLLDSAHVVRTVGSGGLSTDAAWVAKRLGTIRVVSRLEPTVISGSPTRVEWLGTTITREELQTLSYTQIRARLSAAGGARLSAAGGAR